MAEAKRRSGMRGGSRESSIVTRARQDRAVPLPLLENIGAPWEEQENTQLWPGQVSSLREET